VDNRPAHLVPTSPSFGAVTKRDAPKLRSIESSGLGLACVSIPRNSLWSWILYPDVRIMGWTPAATSFDRDLKYASAGVPANVALGRR